LAEQRALLPLRPSHKEGNQMKFNMPAFTVALSSLGLLGGCGGGGGSAPPSAGNGGNTSARVSGTVAVGYPIIGANVAVKCASGFTASATTGIDGTWAATVADTAYPCVVQASGGTANGIALLSPLHSMMLGSGNVNVTPLTDLIVANVTGQDPATWFTNANSGQLVGAITSTNINNAVGVVSTVLASLPGQPSLPNGFNPITTPFTANQVDAGDVVLDNYAAGLALANMTRDDAVSNVAAGSTTLTQEAQTLKVFGATGSSELIQFQGGLVRTSDGNITLTIPDSRGQARTVNVTSRDAEGNVNGMTSSVFNGIVSVFGNRFGQLCVEGTAEWDYDDLRRAVYTYVSADMIEVTDLEEIRNVVFTLYDGCAFRDATMQYSHTTDEYVVTSYHAWSNTSSTATTWGGPRYENNPAHYVGWFTTQRKVFKYVDEDGHAHYAIVYNTAHTVRIGVSDAHPSL